MSKSLRTLIEWAHYSLNFWWGCTKVSPACEHCYAEVISKVFSKGQATWGRGGKRWLQWDSATRKLVKIVRAAKREGMRPRVFVNSMSDTFEDNALLDVTRCMALVAMAEVTAVDFLLLTKRPENVRKMVPAAWLEKWPAHVWIGTTVENQAAADERIPHLLCVPAAVRFLSCEPLLGPLDLAPWIHPDGKCEHCGKLIVSERSQVNCACCGEGPEQTLERSDLISWVIIGGESGGGARPMHPDWARSLRDQCAAAGVPFFFKQWGEWIARSQYLYVGNEPIVQSFVSGKQCQCAVMRRDGGIDSSLGEASTSNDSDSAIVRVGKKLAGRLLDGVEHNAVPVAANTEGSASSSK